MAIEFEATYLNIDEEEIRSRLKNIGAKLIRSEYKQRRYNFDLQSLGRNFWEWVRIRFDFKMLSFVEQEKSMR